ncbi:hypothetical protein C3486_02310 [Streptomyces sp. Ru73]|uniref:hypothetical protein n=1 Tax=Streptomyces sp. Ru73 TaxID=2080748 RepID=UPI000CDE29B5|nr:hypothetical protein [Streptomyces sp. Ru73]POX43072.1 hypothetical protein C3486_02310 [Streptomyces sp. Ru73]
MQLTQLVGQCHDGDCPTLYTTGRGALTVQGDRLTDHGLEIPARESIVEIPIELIRKAIRENLI